MTLISREESIGKTIKEIKTDNLCPGASIIIFTDNTALVIKCTWNYEDPHIRFNPPYSEEIVKEFST